MRGTEQIDFDTFMGWWKRKAMASQRFAEKFDKIGLREGAARIRTPDVRATAETQNTHTQRFFSSKLRGRKDYWVEVVGTRMSIYRSQADREEKARLQLSDEEIVGVNALPEGFEIQVVLGGRDYRVQVRFCGDAAASQIAEIEGWVSLIRLAIEHKHDNRSGKELWHIARNRAPLVTEVSRFLGADWMGDDDAGAAGGSGSGPGRRQEPEEPSSIYTDPILPPGVRNPQSSCSMFWDFLQVVMLMSVCYFVPIRTCFSVEVELWSGAFWWDAVVDVYFIVDVVVNFRTAFYNHKGMLITDTRAIAEHYLTGWFAIDFLSCLPVGYINYFSDDPATGAALPSFTHCFFHA